MDYITDGAVFGIFTRDEPREDTSYNNDGDAPSHPYYGNIPYTPYVDRLAPVRERLNEAVTALNMSITSSKFLSAIDHKLSHLAHKTGSQISRDLDPYNPNSVLKQVGRTADLLDDRIHGKRL